MSARMDPGEIDQPYTEWWADKALSLPNGRGLDPLAVRVLHSVMS